MHTYLFSGMLDYAFQETISKYALCNNLFLKATCLEIVNVH